MYTYNEVTAVVLGITVVVVVGTWFAATLTKNGK